MLKELLNEGHEVLLLEKNDRICKTIVEEMGSVCYRGDGCEAATLAEVGTSRADMLVAVVGQMRLAEVAVLLRMLTYLDMGLNLD